MDKASDSTWHRAMGDIVDDLPAAGAAAKRYALAMRQGDMDCGLYAPRGHDPQGPHDRDELYIVRTGQARFVRGEEVVDCAAGDLLFVPAGMVHRFIDMTDDFSTWVIFWGPTRAAGEP